jgi:glycerol-3-phosphate acyltransferase PlsX
MRIGIDAMGGDHAPVEEVKGALGARDLLGPEDRIVLVGQEPALRQQLASAPGWEAFIALRHAEQVVGMGEPPVESLRDKPDSSLAVLVKMHRDHEIDAAVSAGNTGAFVAAATMHLRRLRGVHRPGIAVVAPTYHGPVTICDVGANVSCRPQHLHQYGVMASLYATAVSGIKQPRVGLLSIGEEDAKGNELVKSTRDLLRDEASIRYIGNVEGRDIFSGEVDVVVCEGFVGNVVLKLVEGMGSSMIKGFVEDLRSAMPDQMPNIKKALNRTMIRWDFNEYGGAPLLGVGGICIICHGASSYIGIKNAVRAAKEFSRQHVNESITSILSRQEKIAHG